MAWRREPWDPPRGAKVLTIVVGGGCGLLVLVVLGTYVEVLQPAAFRLAGAIVDDLGGGQRSANVVVGGIYLVAIGAAAAWTRLLRARRAGPLVIAAAAAALPPWLCAIGLAPPSRDSDENVELISGWVGDDVLGARLDEATLVGAGLVLVAVAVWWVVQRAAGDPREKEIASRLERF